MLPRVLRPPALLGPLPILPLVALAGCVAGGPPAPTAVSCAEIAPVGEVLTLDPDGAAGQIQPFALWDGSAVQVVYGRVRPDAPTFSVQAQRVICDGSVGRPRTVEPEGPSNETDPTAAIVDGGLLVAYQRDDGGAPFNLSIGLSLLPLRGDDGGAATRLTMTRGGQEYAGNAWMPRLVSEQGGAVLAGSRGIDQIGRFQTFVQRLDPDGRPLSDSVDVGLEAETSQLEPAVAVDADGALLVAWEHRPDDGPNDVRWRPLSPDLAAAADVTELVPVATLPDAAAVQLAALPGAADALAVVHGGDGDLDVLVRRLRGGGAVTLGAPDALDHTPGVAVGDGRALVAFHRVVSGIRNDLFVVTVRLDGDPDQPLSASAPRRIETPEFVAPYTPAVTHVAGDLFFLAWSDGISPDLVVRGMFVVAE